MAKTKETFNVRGRELTAHERDVYNKIVELGKQVTYNDLVDVCGGGDSGRKSAIATLARLEKTHGLLKKNEPQKLTTYEVANLESE